MTNTDNNQPPQDEHLEEDILKDVFKVIKELEDDQHPDLAFVLSHTDEVVAQLIESIPAHIRRYIWDILPPERSWPVLLQLQLDTVSHLVDDLEQPQLQRLQETASPQDIISLADALPDEMVDAILLTLEDAEAVDLQEALSYEDSQVGRYIDKHFLSVRPGFSVANIVKKIRNQENIVAIFVVNRAGEFLGQLAIKSLLLCQEDKKAQDLIEPVASFDHNDSLKSAAMQLQYKEAIEWYPVFNKEKLLGAISIWTLLEELQEQSIEASISEAPKSEEDLFTPVSVAAKTRALWLSINLLTAFLASWVIGWFEATLQEVVALAILMPVVASMGGIAGSQTLAVALRGLTLNYLNDANIKLVLVKEAKIAILNGILLGLVIALIVTYWFSSTKLGAIILIAIAVNSLAAASSGTFIPFVLKKMNIDPAVSASVILTTVTDVVGFFIFLGLASIIF